MAIPKLITPKGGVWQIMLTLFQKKQGKVVTNEELIKATGQHNYARRLRELRSEGWDIAYQNPNGYILRSLEKIEKDTDVYINLKLRQKVLERDSSTCQLCGYKGSEKYSDGETVRLEVDHKTPLNQGGRTVEENLWTMCSRCNAGKKSLLAYPETVKNKIISLNLPDDLRTELSGLSTKTGRTVNDLLLDALRNGIKKLK